MVCVTARLEDKLFAIVSCTNSRQTALYIVTLAAEISSKLQEKVTIVNHL